jgi:hypothetical protein
MARTKMFDRRQTDFFFVKIGFSSIKSRNLSRKSIKKKLKITKSKLYINFVNRVIFSMASLTKIKTSTTCNFEHTLRAI